MKDFNEHYRINEVKAEFYMDDVADMLKDMNVRSVTSAEALGFLNDVKDWIIEQEKELRKTHPELEEGELKALLSQSFKDGLW